MPKKTSVQKRRKPVPGCKSQRTRKTSSSAKTIRPAVKAKPIKSARTDTTHHKTTEENTSRIILDTEQFEKLETTQIDKEYIDTIINQLPIPIAILKVNEVNGEYHYIYEFVNESITKLNNRTKKEHIGHSLEEIITVEEAAQDIKANFHKVIKSKKIIVRQISIPINGKIEQLLEFHFPIEYNNSVVSVGAALIDITELVQVRKEAEKRSQELQESHEKLETRVQERTKKLKQEIAERKRVEYALKENEDRLSLVLEATTDGVWDWNISTGHVVFSPQWFRSLGYEPGELEPHVSSWEKLVHPNDMPKLREALKAHFEGKTLVYQFENRLLNKSGTYRWNLDRGRVVSRDQNGKPLRMVGTDTDITVQKLHEKKLRQRNQQLKNLLAHLENVREEERVHIAREVHDELGQILTAFKFDLSELEELIPPDSERVENFVKKLIKDVDNTLESVQRILTRLRPQVLDIFGVGPAFEWQANEFQDQTGIACEVIHFPENLQMDKEKSLLLFRILQEALMNVKHHAKASQVQIDFRVNDENMIMEIKDNGVGMKLENVNDPQSFGILGIQERADLLGGTASFRSNPGEGTTVSIRLPK